MKKADSLCNGYSKQKTSTADPDGSGTTNIVFESGWLV